MENISFQKSLSPVHIQKQASHFLQSWCSDVSQCIIIPENLNYEKYLNNFKKLPAIVLPPPPLDLPIPPASCPPANCPHTDSLEECFLPIYNYRQEKQSLLTMVPISKIANVLPTNMAILLIGKRC